ncbi:MAG: radical SAM protein, partial [Desulfobulbaceae bacterium]|nr:radical SAM protein [Desulfobulbaceae bacterium]
MNPESIRRGLKEVKFVRSFRDLEIFYTQKLPFFLSRLFGDPSREIGIPLSIQIEPTNYCNLSCVFCSTGKSPRKKNYMDFALFEKIVDDASGIGVKRIHLYLHGEPMLHKQIVKMIRHIKQKGLGVTITSNGMLFDKSTIKEILESGVN